MEEYDVGRTGALYETVKITIFQDFEAMKRQCSLIVTATNNTELKMSLINFRVKYSNFFQDVNNSRKLSKIELKKQKYLLYFYYNREQINKTVSIKLTSICRELIEELGLTRIEFEQRDDLGF